MARLIFIDSAKIEDIKKWNNRISCAGVTTNQKLFALQKGVDFKKTILSLCRLANAPVSVELTMHESTSSMVKEARIYASWHKHVVIKVPMTQDGMGLEVIKKLTKHKIKTNATLMVSFEQMLLAINAGATYASILFNRAKDGGYDEKEIIKRSRNFIDNGGYKCQIITGSIRDIRDVGDSFEYGSDIVTIPPTVLNKMLYEPKTQKLLEEMDEAWEEFLKK
jgi:transaldolase